MIPGEIITSPGDIELNAGSAQVTIEVANTGDRPIQVGSHYHFYETNNGLKFDRENWTAASLLEITAIGLADWLVYGDEFGAIRKGCLHL